MAGNPYVLHCRLASYRSLLQFFIHERNPEVLARNLLLLSIATDWELPVRQRAAVWLEVFGNALLQARTARYVSSKRGGLIDLVCNGRGPEPLATILDTSLLKVRHVWRCGLSLGGAERAPHPTYAAPAA